jgi:hypothetical protein
MLGKVKSLDTRLLARRCVSCGYDGALLRNGDVRRCPRCDCDLQKRPARSYAEMEGLIGQPMILHTPIFRDRSEPNVMHRWLAFLFLWAMLLGAIACLSVAAMAAV